MRGGGKYLQRARSRSHAPLRSDTISPLSTVHRVDGDDLNFISNYVGARFFWKLRCTVNNPHYSFDADLIQTDENDPGIGDSKGRFGIYFQGQDDVFDPLIHTFIERRFTQSNLFLFGHAYKEICI